MKAKENVKNNIGDQSKQSVIVKEVACRDNKLKNIGVLFLMLFIFCSCNSSFVKPLTSNEIKHQPCFFDKAWFEQTFRAKNIFRIDKEYDATLIMIMFKSSNSNDANMLLEALNKLSRDVYMTKSPNYYQIYISQRTLLNICRK